MAITGSEVALAMQRGQVGCWTMGHVCSLLGVLPQRVGGLVMKTAFLGLVLTGAHVPHTAVYKVTWWL